MGLTDVLRSRRLKRLSTARLLFKAARAFARGEHRTGLALLGAAAVSVRSTALGFLAEGVIRLLRRRGGLETSGEPRRVPPRARLGAPDDR